MMAWKIKHVSFESGFTTLASPCNKILALKEFDVLKKKYTGLFTLYAPSGKKFLDYFNKK